jgi:transcriptional regulator with XRE-family HTH domain
MTKTSGTNTETPMNLTTTVISSFGEHLRCIRFDRNLSQLDVGDLSRQIADREGSPDFIIRNSQLSAIEHDRALPGPAKLLTLAEIYGLSREQLVKLWAMTNRHQQLQSASNGTSQLLSEESLP